MIYFKKLIPVAFIDIAKIGISSCAAMNTAITHRKLNVQTKMSQSIFLKPVHKSHKIVYVDSHNALNQTLKLTPMIKSAVQEKVYRVVNSMGRAHLGKKARSTTLAIIQQGSDTQRVARLSKRFRRMQYRKRIVSTADKVNLIFAQSKSKLTRQLAHFIASLFQIKRWSA